MNMGEELVKAMSPHGLFEINLFGLKVFITDTIFVMWLVMAAIIIFAYILTRNLKTVPHGKQNLVEAFVEFISNFAKENMGHFGKHFTPYLGTLLLFLIFSNIISIFNILPIGSILHAITGVEAFKDMAIRPPTRDPNLTICLALISILVVALSSIKFRGFKGWLHYHIEPVPIMLPFKLMDYFIRTLSLSMRLFGNILGAFIVMELLYAAMPILVPAGFSIYFDLFDGILQAYVFVFLTSLYIAEAVE
jgi:F-type H+-transporting ATPase subunit a